MNNNLKDYMDLDTKECLNCNKIFTRNESLKKHVMKRVCFKEKNENDKIKKNDNGNFKCNICNFETKYKNSFIRHMKKCEPKQNITINNIKDSTINTLIINPVKKEKSSHVIKNKNIWLKLIEINENNCPIGHMNYLDEVHLNEKYPENINKHFKTQNKSLYYLDETEPYFKKSNKKKVIDDIFEKVADDYNMDLFKGYAIYRKELTEKEKMDFKNTIDFFDNNKDEVKIDCVEYIEEKNKLTMEFKRNHRKIINDEKLKEKFILSNIENLIPSSSIVPFE